MKNHEEQTFAYIFRVDVSFVLPEEISSCIAFIFLSFRLKIKTKLASEQQAIMNGVQLNSELTADIIFSVAGAPLATNSV